MAEVIECLPGAPAPSAYDDFARDILIGIAAGLGISYEKLATDYYVMKVGQRITPRIVQLCSSDDRRQVQRGTRLYHELNRKNGSIASRSFLKMKVDRFKQERLDSARNADLRAFVNSAVDLGTIFMPEEVV